MTGDKLLSQEEIDMLMRKQIGDNGPDAEAERDNNDLNYDMKDDLNNDLNNDLDNAPPAQGEEKLTAEEKDALGEIGNISMGTASTALSELLNKKVSITSPEVWLANKREFLSSFTVPYLIIKVEFIDGLQGFNVLIMKEHDAKVIANLMMGGDGSTEGSELSEMEISAASEAMNVMIGSSSTSLAQIFNKPVNISPPVSVVLYDKNMDTSDKILSNVDDQDTLVIVSFKMTIEQLIDTEIMQVMGIETAKEQADLLWRGLRGMDEVEAVPQTEEVNIPASDKELDELIDSLATEPQPTPTDSQPVAPSPTAPPSGVSQPAKAQTASVEPPPRNLDLILDIPLKVSVVLGRTRKSIKEVMDIGPGSVIEMNALADEPVEVLVNGMLVAEGEVVVVNENFGVKITNIISPEERIKRLAK